MMETTSNYPEVDRALAVERACYCPMYRPSKIRIQEYFVCDPARPECDMCKDCPINGLREPQSMAITYNVRTVSHPGDN